MATGYRKVKDSIITVCHDLVRLGLTLGTWGNVSAKVHDGKCFVITPSGMSYDCIGPEALVTVDPTGKTVAGSKRPSIETPLHLAVYAKRPDVGAIVHTHSVFATAAAAAREPIPAIVEDMAQIIGGGVDVAVYAMPGSQALADNVVTALGQRNAVLLANHGVIGVGADVYEAFKVCQVVEKSAQVYAYAKLFGQPAVLDDDDIREMHTFYKTKYRQE